MQPLGDVAPVTDVALVGRQTSPGASIKTSQRVVPKERMNEKVPNSHCGHHLAAPAIEVAEVAVVTPDRTTRNIVTPAPQELLPTDDLLADASTTNEEEDRVADAAPAANGLSYAFVDYITHETFKVVKLVEKTNEKGSPSTFDIERVQPKFGAPPSTCGNQLMGFGKYCGRTYAQVYADDRGYCRWALRESYPGIELSDFVHYLKKQNDDVIGCDR
jgi:hypothetical protein